PRNSRWTHPRFAREIRVFSDRACKGWRCGYRSCSSCSWRAVRPPRAARRRAAGRFGRVEEPGGYRAVWAAGADQATRGKAVADALGHVKAHGLDPTTYHGHAIARRAAGARPEARAAVDVLASDGIMRLAAHLRLGVIRPGSVDKDAA